MSLLSLLAHTPTAKGLGWALFHFLWQGAALALLLALSFLALRGARARYAAACGAMLAMVAAFAVTFALEYPRVAPIELSHAHRLAAAPDAAASNLPFAPQPAGPADPLPWIAPFWAAGVLLFHLRSMGSWMAAGRLKRRGVCAPPAEWQARLEELARAMRISTPVRLLESCLADAPMVASYLKPVILVPAGMLAGLPAEQLEAILIHELAHVRRHDYVVNVLQTLVEGLLFYHPAVWWVSNVIRAERENCCDDAAVRLSGGARQYAAALAALEVNRSAARHALAANGGSLVKRIRRLLNQPESPRAILTPLLSAAILTVAIAVTAAAWQAPADNPQPQRAAAPAPAAMLAIPTAEAAQAPVARPAVVSVPKAAPARVSASAPLLAALQDDRIEKLKKQLQGESQLNAARAQSAAGNLAGPYLKWLQEDVAYIITDSERAAYKNLTTDDERENFIKQFWARRDPTPNTPENEFKDEHYRRIEYANEHFQASVPGWKTDRGRIYITFGPPNEIEDHSTDAAARAPYQQWRYRYIEGVGNDVIVEFVDANRTGEYRMSTDPTIAAHAAAAGKVDQWEAQMQSGRGGRGGRGGSLSGGVSGGATSFVPVTLTTSSGPGLQMSVAVASSVNGRAKTQVGITGDGPSIAGRYDIMAEVMTGSNVAANARDSMTIGATAGKGPLQYNCTFQLAPGAYTVNLVLRDPAGKMESKTLNFNVN